MVMDVQMKLDRVPENSIYYVVSEPAEDILEDVKKEPRRILFMFDDCENALFAFNHMVANKWHFISLGHSVAVYRFTKNKLDDQAEQKIISWNRKPNAENGMLKGLFKFYPRMELVG